MVLIIPDSGNMKCQALFLSIHDSTSPKEQERPSMLEPICTSVHFLAVVGINFLKINP
jgi:hypothetical protein